MCKAIPIPSFTPQLSVMKHASMCDRCDLSKCPVDDPLGSLSALITTQ